MRILLIIKNFDLGGAESHVCLLANSLAENGNEVFVVSNAGLQVQNLDIRVKHIIMNVSDAGIPFSFIRLVRLIRKEKIEIIHAHQRIAIYLANLSGQFSSIPVVATIHGRIRYDLRSSFVKKRTHKFITVSENSLKGTRSDRFLKDKSVLIRNSLQTNGMIYKNKLKNLFVFYAGRFDKRQGNFVRMLVSETWQKIANDYPEVQLSISGNGPEKKMILKSIKRFNSQNEKVRIKYNGYSSSSLVGLNQSSLVLGVGRIAIESLAAGIPVFSVNAKHCGQIITTQNYQQYLYGNFVAIDNDPPTPEKIILVITDFITRQDYFMEEAEKLMAMVKKDFDNVNTTRQVIDLYKSVLTKQLQT